MTLMELTSKVSLQMHHLCYEAGGHCTSYGNSSEGCSVVSPGIFRKFGKPFEIRLDQQLKAEGIPTICHICGWADPILEDLAETGCPMYEFRCPYGYPQGQGSRARALCTLRQSGPGHAQQRHPGGG